jgi:signal transduction histidine kinase
MIRICLLLLLVPGWLAGQTPMGPIVLDDSIRRIYPWKKGQISFLEDTSHHLTLQQVRSPMLAQQFVNSRQHRPNFGFSSSSFWLRFQVRHQTTRPLQWVVDCYYPLLDSVDCYQINEHTGAVITKPGGRMRLSRLRDIDAHEHAFPLEVTPNQTYTIYLRIAGNGAKVFNLAILETHTFYTNYQKETWIWGISLGFLLCVILLQLTFFAVTRSRDFLFYALYLVAFLGVEITRGNGLIGDRYLWPNQQFLKQHGLVLAALLAIFFGLLFYANGLRLRIYAPNWARALLTGKLVALLLITGYLISPGSQNIILLTVGLGVATNLLIIPACLTSLRRGYSPARFYLLATVSFLMGLAATVLWLLEVLPKNFITNNAINLGSAFEQLFFALALADDYRRTRYQREQSQEELILALKSRNAEISAALLQGQTLERKRVAADLHDTLGSTLSSLRWALEAIDKTKLTPAEQAVYATLDQQLNQAYTDVRLLSHNLLPDELAKQGLSVALPILINKLNRNTSVRFVVSIPDPYQRLAHQTEFELYSICLELFNNVLKHANATEVYLTLTQLSNMIYLTLGDNGTGLNKKREAGQGLTNIAARVEALGGIWLMESPPDKGVTHRISVPINGPIRASSQI